MNPIQSYFNWHDARYLKHAEDPQKNRSAIKMFRVLRVFLLLATALAGVFLGTTVALSVLKPGILPDYGMLILSGLFGFGAIIYTWVTEALLFRRYIENHRKI